MPFFEGDNKWKWIIDPLDGTTNYAHGYPCFCVTLALEHDGEIVIGVTFDPTRNELFAAEKGKGATLNNKPIRVSETEKFGESLIVTGFPYNFKEKENFARHLTDFLIIHEACVATVRRRLIWRMSPADDSTVSGKKA